MFAFFAPSSRRHVSAGSRTSDRLSAHVSEGRRVLGSRNPPHATWNFTDILVFLPSLLSVLTPVHTTDPSSVFVRTFLQIMPIMMLMLLLHSDSRAAECLRSIYTLFKLVLWSFSGLGLPDHTSPALRVCMQGHRWDRSWCPSQITQFRRWPSPDTFI